MTHRPIPERLGPHDVVDAPGYDQHGIPLGDHTATCGCRLTGRTLREPCDTHKADPILNRFSMRADYETPEWKIEVGDAIRKAVILRHSIADATALHPVGIILPRSLNPRPYDVAGECMGLPVTWGDRVALIYDAE